MVLGAGEPVTESDAGNHCQGSCIVAVEHAIPPRDVPVGSCGRPALGIPVITGKDDHVEEISEEPAELVERVAALDIGKAMLVACVRVPHDPKPGRRRQEIRTFATTTRSLLGLADWLDCLGVTRVVMEATSTYWKPPFYLLEESCACWLVNARQVKHVPGRPTTDTQDAVWLAKLAERGMLRPSFVPPPWQRELRDLTRYRRTLLHERTREKQRVEKLEDTQIKLSAVVSDMFGVSGRQMLEALIAGQRDPKVLAQLAQGRMRSKLGVLAEALTGHFRAHHGYRLRMMLDRIDALGAQADQLTGRIEELLAPLPIRWSSWMRSPAWAGSARRSSSPRSAWRWVAFPAPGIWCRGPSSPPRPKPRPARPNPAPPARATPGSAPPSGRRRWEPPRPRPSSAPATGGS
jgi:transposase